jgi:DNA-directed RNA polymerase subunit N (RpoN/RPB10)
LFVENKSIEGIAALEEAVKETSISFGDWKTQFENDETEKAVLDDLQLAQAYSVKREIQYFCCRRLNRWWLFYCINIME